MMQVNGSLYMVLLGLFTRCWFETTLLNHPEACSVQVGSFRFYTGTVPSNWPRSGSRRVRHVHSQAPHLVIFRRYLFHLFSVFLIQSFYFVLVLHYRALIAKH